MITGGTGSFGNAVLNRFLSTDIAEIRIFSRDEKKQDDMRHDYQLNYPDVAHKIKFYIGDVYYGGSYDLEKNGSLLTLIENAKPTFTAKTDYVFVERTRPDETVEVLTVPFPGVNGNPDFTLQARDVVRVMQQSTYRDIDTIAVSGEVRVPFLRQFGLNDRMTISQAIEYAGGLKPNVFPVAYIFRKDLTNPDKMEYLRVSLETDGDMLLQPGDRLNVYDNSTYTNIGEIRINGAVKKSVWNCL